MLAFIVSMMTAFESEANGGVQDVNSPASFNRI